VFLKESAWHYSSYHLSLEGWFFVSQFLGGNRLIETKTKVKYESLSSSLPLKNRWYNESPFSRISDGHRDSYFIIAFVLFNLFPLKNWEAKHHLNAMVQILRCRVTPWCSIRPPRFVKLSPSHRYVERGNAYKHMYPFLWVRILWDIFQLLLHLDGDR